MPSPPDSDAVRCPICRANQPWSDACRRCQGDLRLLHTFARAYHRRRLACLRALRSGDPRSAVRAARDCHELAPSPESARLLVRAYDGSALTLLRRVSLPLAVPHLVAAAGLAAPRALLGVMIAEYLATGGGLGFLLAESRGKLAFGMMWAIAAVVVVVSVALHTLVSVVEGWAGRRFAPGARS